MYHCMNFIASEASPPSQPLGCLEADDTISGCLEADDTISFPLWSAVMELVSWLLFCCVELGGQLGL